MPWKSWSWSLKQKILIFDDVIVFIGAGYDINFSSVFKSFFDFFMNFHEKHDPDDKSDKETETNDEKK